MARRRVGPLRVIVPMKPLYQAKSRLWADVPTYQRQGAILMMLDQVVRASVEALGPTACVVVGGDELVRKVTTNAGATWSEDSGGGLNGALWTAMKQAYADGCSATLFMPGDLPSVEPDDVVQLALCSDDYSRPVGVRAADDGGTNALLVPAASAFEPELGKDSFAKHVAAAKRTGTTLIVADIANLAFDVDSYEDFEWAKQHVTSFAQKLYDWQAKLHLGRL